MVVANVELVLLINIEIKTGQKYLSVVGLVIRSLLTQREVECFVNAAGNRPACDSGAAQLVKEDCTGLKQLLLFIGNKKERLVFAPIMTAAALAKTRNRERAAYVTSKLLLSGRRNLTKGVLCRQAC